MSGVPPEDITGLRAEFPAWTFWRGEHTRSYWAMPPWGGELLSADSPEALGVIVSAALRARGTVPPGYRASQRPSR